MTASAGLVLSPGPLTDSVDADDGQIDGSGTGGRSYHTNGVNHIDFSFDATALGGLPTVAGVVWTDVGETTGAFAFGVAYLLVYDSNGVPQQVTNFTAVGDRSSTSGTAEDRFFGVGLESGILRITIAMLDSSDFEVDHLQYGQALPEPGAWVSHLAGLALAAVWAQRQMGHARHRRRRAPEGGVGGPRLSQLETIPQ